MFSRPTVIVLGAGASVDFGFPLGSKLTLDVAKLLKFRFDHATGGGMKDGDPFIFEALDLIAQRARDRNEIQELCRAAWRIADGVPLSRSIDNFLDLHQDDERMLTCGKLAIVRAILKAEKASPLYRDDRKHPKEPFDPLPDTWLARFFKALHTGVAKTNVETIFDPITVINFNYDRCFEVYMAAALEAVYAIPQVEAQQLIDQRLQIFHPYGTVGPLPWQAKAVPFGAEQSPQRLLELSAGIRTFTEQVHDSDVTEQIRRAVSRAHALVFLGFGFHKQNMELMTPGPELRTEHSGWVYATSKDVSSADQGVVTNRINSMLASSHTPGPATNLHDFDCGQLLDHYALTLSP